MFSFVWHVKRYDLDPDYMQKKGILIKEVTQSKQTSTDYRNTMEQGETGSQKSCCKMVVVVQ